MRFNGLKRTLSLFICLLATNFIFNAGCHAQRPEKDETNESEIAENVHIITSLDDLKKVFSPDITPQQAVTLIKDIVTSLIPLDMSAKNKKELNEIAKYLDSIKKPSEYFNDDNNIIYMSQKLVQLSVTMAEIEPGHFDANYQIAYHYFSAGNLIKSLSQSEEHKLLSAEYKKKGFQAAKDLVKKFPDEAKAYHQLGFFVNIVEGKKKKALELYKRCLELDPKMELCQKHYDVVLEELNK